METGGASAKSAAMRPPRVLDLDLGGEDMGKHVLRWMAAALLWAVAPAHAGHRVLDAFVAGASPSQEVAATPVISPASCFAIFRFLAKESKVRYRLECFNIRGVVGAHLHLGSARINGPVVVPLFSTNRPTGEVDGTLSQGVLTPDQLVGFSLDDLLEAMRTDRAYVNVHTVAYPAGEVRGQVIGVQLTILEGLPF